jgi:DNA-binding transcriptional LysR family regulator
VIAWDDLRFVLAVHRRKTLSAAAQDLGVDKATVSRRITAIESALGARLFDRRREGYVLNERGERALARLEAIESQVTGMQMDLEGEDERASGVVRITMPLFFATAIVIPALPRLREKHPGLRPILQTSNALVDMPRRQADIAIRNIAPRDGDWIAKKLFRIGIAAYTRNAHDNEPLIGFEGARLAPGFPWLDADRAAICVNDSIAAFEACRAGLGVAVLPCVIGDGQLTRLPFPVHHEDVYAVVHRSLHRAARIRSMVAFIAELGREHQSALGG